VRVVLWKRGGEKGGIYIHTVTVVPRLVPVAELKTMGRKRSGRQTKNNVADFRIHSQPAKPKNMSSYLITIYFLSPVNRDKTGHLKSNSGIC